MAFLSLIHSNNSYACVHYINTPANRTEAAIVKGADITAGLVGLGAAVATIFTGEIKLREQFLMYFIIVLTKIYSFS